MANNKGFFKKLMDGDFGLAKTYWLYGFLVGVIFGVVAQVAIYISPILYLLVFLISIAYYIPLAIGIWRAANRYTGPKIWAILAKIAVILGVLNIIATLLILPKTLHIIATMD